MNPASDLLSLIGGRAEIVLLLAGRFGGMMVLAPVFGARVLPPRVRLALAVLPALALLPGIRVAVAPLTTGEVAPLALLVMVAREALVGLAIGLAAQFAVAGAVLGAQIAGLQMGLGMANLIDPQTHDQVTTFAQWQQVVAVLLLLAVDGHHELLRVVAASFSSLPLGAAWISPEGALLAVTLARGCFTLALEVAAPVLVVVLMVNAALGALSKLVPQLNVMAVGFGLNVGAGIFVLTLAQPPTLRLLERSYAALGGELTRLVLRLG